MEKYATHIMAVTFVVTFMDVRVIMKIWSVLVDMMLLKM